MNPVVYAYYGRVLYSGRVNLIKELTLPPTPAKTADSQNPPSNGHRADWALRAIQPQSTA